MLQKIILFADGHSMLPRGAVVTAAVSGGADSVALLTALDELAPSRGLTLHAAHFDHRLRGAESDGDREFVKSLCERLKIPCHIGSGDARALSRERGRGIEDAARELRYNFFGELSERLSSRVAVAHTADDNAETMLLNLARGSGAAGLAGIPPVRGNIIRPMLSVTRAEVEAFLAERGVSHIEDSSNLDEAYSRNLIRRRVIPVLRGLNPRFAARALDAAVRLREDDEYLTSLARNFTQSRCADGTAIVAELMALPRPVASRAVISLAGRSLSSERVDAILALCESSRGTARVSVPGGFVTRVYGKLIFGGDISAAGTFSAVAPRLGETAEIPELSMKVSLLGVSCPDDVKGFYGANEKIHKSFTVFLFKKSDICGRIVVRPRTEGDILELFGGNITKSLKKLFIEKKIPVFRRGLIPVVADALGPLAVCGIAAGARAAPQPGDDTVEIKFERFSA